MFIHRFDVPTADDPARWLCRRCAPVLKYPSTLRSGARVGFAIAQACRPLLEGQSDTAVGE
jgi:hypothetical protein